MNLLRCFLEGKMLMNKKDISNPMYGKRHTEETRKKMSENHVDASGNKNSMWGKFGEKHPRWEKHHSEESRKQMSVAHLGKKLSDETRRKMSENHVAIYGEKHHHWKGNNVGYNGLHYWIRKNKVRTELCEICASKEPREIANISGKYLRDVNDYMWVCCSCHKSYDGIIKNFKGKRKDGQIILEE